MSLTIGSLFAGIGGLELGLEWAGHGPVLWQVEQDEFCRDKLSRNWPRVARFDDVREVGATRLAPVDLLCGGFPCQDVSGAGKGAGLAGARSGLWWEFARIVAELRPTWVVVENVASGAKRWVDAVRSELGRLGYETIPIPIAAADVGAPHLRRRIFIVARALGDAGGKRQSGRPRPDAEQRRTQPETRGLPADADSAGLQGALSQPTRRRAGSADGSDDAANALGEPLREQRQRLPGGRPRAVCPQGHTEPAHDGAAGDTAHPDRSARRSSAGEPGERRRLPGGAEPGRGGDEGPVELASISCDYCGEIFAGRLTDPCHECGRITSGTVTYDLGAVANTHRGRQQGERQPPQPGERRSPRGQPDGCGGARPDGDRRAARAAAGTRTTAQPGLRPLDDGVPSWMAGCRGLMPHPTIEGPSTALDRAKLRALGNAVVPQCAQVVGEVLNLLIERSG